VQELLSQARERAVKWQTLFSVGKFVFLSCDPWKCREFLLTVPEKFGPMYEEKDIEDPDNTDPYILCFITGIA
jgi:hypothetical protein